MSTTTCIQLPTIRALVRRTMWYTCAGTSILCVLFTLIQYKHFRQETISATLTSLMQTTANYYPQMLTYRLAGNETAVQRVLRDLKNAESLTDIAITETLPTNATSCGVYQSKSFFLEVPYCAFVDGATITFYQELRSGGARLGYLKKVTHASDSWVELWRHLMPPMLIWGITLTVIGLVLQRQLNHRLARPLVLLSENAKHFITGEQKERFMIQELQELSEALSVAHSELQSIKERQLNMQANEQIIAVANQVAHDIRSPLTALKVVSDHLAELPEEKRVMIRNAVQRIDDIANDLAGKQAVSHAVDSSAPNQEIFSIQLLSSLIEPLISEKRIQLRARLGIQIQCTLDASSYGVFARVQPVEFKRVLSNLINNAVEAMRDDGEVTLTIAQTDDAVRIAVIDTGNGIPPELLPKLMRSGATFGKEHGSGLGLFHARTSIENWDGVLELQSTVGRGTTVIMMLPRADAPSWFVPELVFTPQQTIVVIDDDASIHHVWDERFEALPLVQHQIHTQHFSSGTEAYRWCETHASTQSLFLCDYELLGDPDNGLDLIEKLGVQERAILVTSRYEESYIQTRCAKLGVRLIPKGLAGYVPIRVDAIAMLPIPAAKNVDAATNHVAPSPSSQTQQLPHVLVIDDDSGIRSVWKLVGRGMGIGTLIAFDSLESCEAAAPDYSQFTLAFVDKHIEKSQWRVDEVVQRLKALGVPRVIVASGEAYEALARDPLCAGADGIAAPKIPESLAPFLA